MIETLKIKKVRIKEKIKEKEHIMYNLKSEKVKNKIEKY